MSFLISAEQTQITRLLIFRAVFSHTDDFNLTAVTWERASLRKTVFAACLMFALKS